MSNEIRELLFDVLRLCASQGDALLALPYTKERSRYVEALDEIAESVWASVVGFE